MCIEISETPFSKLAKTMFLCVRISTHELKIILNRTNEKDISINYVFSRQKTQSTKMTFYEVNLI